MEMQTASTGPSQQLQHHGRLASLVEGGSTFELAAPLTELCKKGERLMAAMLPTPATAAATGPLTGWDPSAACPRRLFEQPGWGHRSAR